MIKKVLTGNQAAAWGAYLSRAQVISAYPITPQTSIIETLADMMKGAAWPYKFVNVESEHSALAVCIASSLTGVRVFTATSAQGLLLMHELLHWAAGARLPIVLVDVNRAVAPGWSIWTDQNDSLAQRDTGWIQFYCASSQEVVDTVIMGYKLAEKVQIPAMVVLDAFVLSHTAEIVELPSEKKVASFLGSRIPVFRLDVNEPRSFGGLQGPDFYQEGRENLAEAMEGSFAVLDDVEDQWFKVFGRRYDAVEPYRMSGAEIVLVTSSTVSSTSRIVVDGLRRRGIKVGMLKVRLFRPFPARHLCKFLRGVKKVAVLDRNFSYGQKGIFFQETQSALYGMPDGSRPLIYGYVVGLGGRDVTPELIEEAALSTVKRKKPEPESIWLGRREDLPPAKRAPSVGLREAVGAR